MVCNKPFKVKKWTRSFSKKKEKEGIGTKKVSKILTKLTSFFSLNLKLLSLNDTPKQVAVVRWRCMIFSHIPPWEVYPTSDLSPWRHFEPFCSFSYKSDGWDPCQRSTCNGSWCKQVRFPTPLINCLENKIVQLQRLSCSRVLYYEGGKNISKMLLELMLQLLDF